MTPRCDKRYTDFPIKSSGCDEVSSILVSFYEKALYESKDSEESQIEDGSESDNLSMPDDHVGDEIQAEEAVDDSGVSENNTQGSEVCDSRS